MIDAIILREANLTDTPAIVALLDLCELGSTGVLTPGSRYWIAVVGMQIIGCVGLEYGTQAVLLRSATVHPNYRRRGLGTQLLQLASAAAEADQIASIYLFSTDAGAYWLSQQFHEVPVPEVVAALPNAYQVQHYDAIGWLPTEVAWRRDLAPQPRAEPILAQRLNFILEADKLKQIIRRTSLMDGSRLENSAEHSWHLALMALTLAEYAPQPIDMDHVVRMLLVHDLVEIDAGDTFAFDLAANATKVDRELAAAERLFGLLPSAEGQALRLLWDEFEQAETNEARFALAIDRFEPLLCNLRNGGGTWREHNVGRAAVLRRMEPIRVGAPALWPYVLSVVATAQARGWIGE
jgi:putative hydrolase of HD superfamily